MTILSARFTRQARRRYVCEWCERPITGAYIRLYGSAHETEKPWTLRLHATEQCCPNLGREPKLTAALAAANASEVVA